MIFSTAPFKVSLTKQVGLLFLQNIKNTLCQVTYIHNIVQFLQNWNYFDIIEMLLYDNEKYTFAQIYDKH